MPGVTAMHAAINRSAHRAYRQTAFGVHSTIDAWWQAHCKETVQRHNRSLVCFNSYLITICINTVEVQAQLTE